MISQKIENKFEKIKGQLKQTWGKLTDDDLKVIEGNKDQLIGKIQERYGIIKEEAQKQVDEWKRSHAEVGTCCETDSTPDRKAS